MDEAISSAIVKRLKETAVKVAPTITFRSMYGGTVMELKKDDPKTRIGGIFSYTNYVSLELTNGFSMADPKGVLEGSGKKRRHIKFHQIEDLKKKDCVYFLREAVSAGKKQ